MNRYHYRNLDHLVLWSNPTKQLHPPNSRVQLPDLARHFPSLFRDDRFEVTIEVHPLVGRFTQCTYVVGSMAQERTFSTLFCLRLGEETDLVEMRFR